MWYHVLENLLRCMTDNRHHMMQFSSVQTVRSYIFKSLLRCMTDHRHHMMLSIGL